MNAETGPFGYRPASAGATLGTAAAWDAVLDCYRRELAARGWQVSDIYIPDTAELDARAWRKGHVTFRLGLQRPHDPRNPTAIDGYRTAYTLQLTADDPRDPSWQSQP